MGNQLTLLFFSCMQCICYPIVLDLCALQFKCASSQIMHLLIAFNEANASSLFHTHVYIALCSVQYNHYTI